MRNPSSPSISKIVGRLTPVRASISWSESMKLVSQTFGQSLGDRRFSGAHQANQINVPFRRPRFSRAHFTASPMQ
jgi:hypothetical protein